MLLKDCPVGSVVRLVGIKGKLVNYPWWEGNFTVEKGYCGNFIIDNDGTPRKGVYNNPDYQFQIVAPEPEPRITFTVGGQEFYVGQRIWSKGKIKSQGACLFPTEEMEICAISHWGGHIIARRTVDMTAVSIPPCHVSTTPPVPHEWKRGDWARHEEKGVVFITGHKSYNGHTMSVTDDKGEVYNISPSELTFISHSEPPK